MPRIHRDRETRKLHLQLTVMTAVALGALGLVISKWVLAFFGVAIGP